SDTVRVIAMGRRLTAEFIGTFVLVLGGTGSAVLAAGFVSPSGPSPGANLNIGFLGVSLAFGLTVVVGACAFGAVSGGHCNPAVTVGLWISRRVETVAVLPYIVVQVLGAIAASGVVAVIASGVDGFDIKENGLAANGWADHSPGGYDFSAAL